MRFLNSEFFFGGVPSDVDAAASISPSFTGCIGDVTFNGKIIDFTQLIDFSGAVIGRCTGLGFKLPKRNNTSNFE